MLLYEYYFAELTRLMIQIFGIFLLSFLSRRKIMTTIEFVMIPEQAIMDCIISKASSPDLVSLTTVAVVTFGSVDTGFIEKFSILLKTEHCTKSNNRVLIT